MPILQSSATNWVCRHAACPVDVVTALGSRRCYRAVVNSARFFAESAGSHADDTWFNPLPLHHVGRIVSGILAVLWSAATFVVVEPFTSQIALRAACEARATIWRWFPRWSSICSMNPTLQTRSSPTRTVIGGATAVDPMLIDQIERRIGIRFLVAYGQSEALTVSVDRDTALGR